MTQHPVDHRKFFLEKMINDHNLYYGAELGVHAGVTFKYMIESCPKLNLIGVDLWNKNQKNVNFYHHLKAWCEKYSDRTTLYRESTFTAHEHVKDSSLDFIFIDALHTYDAVKKDITNWSRKVKSGGFIIGHDFHMDGVRDAVNEIYGLTYTLGPDEIWYKRKN